MKLALPESWIDRWNGLQRREQLFVAGGAALIVGVALFLALSSLRQTNQELTEYRDMLEADLRWLQEQSELIARLDNSCTQGTTELGSDTAVLGSLARRSGLPDSRWQDRGANRYLLSMDKVDGNRMLRLAYQATCEGFTVDRLALETSTEDKNLVNGQMEVHRVN